MRPVVATDQLAVECTAASMEIVVNVIRDGGFDDPPYQKDSSLPPGIYHKGNYFMVAIKKNDGSKYSRKCTTAEEAVKKKCELEAIEAAGGDGEQDGDIVNDGGADEFEQVGDIVNDDGADESAGGDFVGGIIDYGAASMGEAVQPA